MNYGKRLFIILAAAFGMFIAITGICFITGYFEVSNPKSGYALLVVGGSIALFYLNKMRSI